MTAGADVVPSPASPLSSQWPVASSGGRGTSCVSVARGGEAEPLLDRVIHDELHPDDADDMHEPRLIDRYIEMGIDRWE